MARTGKLQPSVISHKEKGLQAYKKGYSFQHEVAELYKLLGGEVTENIVVGKKKVDILVRFQIPGSSGFSQSIVECKDEKNPPNQRGRVMELRGDIEELAERGQVLHCRDNYQKKMGR